MTPSPFAAAFAAAFAGPVGLYAPIPNYVALCAPQPVAYHFIAVGEAMKLATQTYATTPPSA